MTHLEEEVYHQIVRIFVVLLSLFILSQPVLACHCDDHGHHQHEHQSHEHELSEKTVSKNSAPQNQSDSTVPNHCHQSSHCSFKATIVQKSSLLRAVILEQTKNSPDFYKNLLSEAHLRPLFQPPASLNV